MLEKIIDLDKDFFVFLNNLGSEPFDPIWLLITKQFNWIPFFPPFSIYFIQENNSKTISIRFSINCFDDYCF